MSAKKSLMRKLRWSASGGGLILFLGLWVTVANQAAGFIIALAGLLILIGITYLAYNVGKTENAPPPDDDQSRREGRPTT